jgi:[ribosomal protein S18]-alanine N-acetyltransferase
MMQPADLKAVAAVERAAYEYPWSLGIFRDCLLAGYYCLVLDVGGSVTGYGIMSVAAGEAHLLNLCVHPGAQRLGYGRRMLNTLLLKASDAQADKVFLLYRSAGFDQIGVRPAYYQAANGREDAVILAATLRSAH